MSLQPERPSWFRGWCCYCCSRHCCPKEEKKKKISGGLEYELVPSAGDEIFQQIPPPRYIKSYLLPQGKAEYTLPLQFNKYRFGAEDGSNGIRNGNKSDRVITQQPLRIRSKSTSVLPDLAALNQEKEPSVVVAGPLPEKTSFKKRPLSVSHSLPLGEQSLCTISDKRQSLHLPQCVDYPQNFQAFSASDAGRDEVYECSLSPGPSPGPITSSTSYTNEWETSGGWRPTLSSIEDEDEGQEEEEYGSEVDSLALEPEIEFSLYYDIQCRTLTVHLQCARNLPRKSKAIMNPIVILYLLPNREDTLQTRNVGNTNNPYFEQSLEFKGLLPDEIRRQTLIFRVYSQASKGDLLGGLAVPLAEADLFGMVCSKKIDVDIEKMKIVSRGDMLISLTYNQKEKRLQGVLLKATNLQKQDIVGLADPYVKIWLLHKGKRYQKWKSRVKRNTLIPIFNETFQFDISDVDIQDLAMEVLTMDYDRFSRNDIVGVVYIGDRVPHETGRQHWEQIIAQPNTSISNWHSILPITAETETTSKRRRISEPVMRSLRRPPVQQVPSYNEY